MGLFNVRKTDYGTKEKYELYRQPVVYGVALSSGTSSPRRSYDKFTPAEKQRSDDRRVRYYRKKCAELIEIANMNDFHTFLTLTFSDSIISYDRALAYWQSFLKRLRHHFPKKELCYICVWEFQKHRSQKEGIETGKGIYHFHMLCNIKYIEHEVLQRIWGQGYVYIEALKGTYDKERAIRYCVKYLIKDLLERIESNTDIRRQRFIYSSNNLKKPVTAKYMTDQTMEDIIFENLEKDIIKEGEYEIKNADGKAINLVDYIEIRK